MPLQLQNRWREDTHHYVRWSQDSRGVIRLYKPRLQQQLTHSRTLNYNTCNATYTGTCRSIPSEYITNAPPSSAM